MPDPASPPRLIRFGVFEVDLRSGELLKHGRMIKVHGQPIDVLAMLLERPAEMVTREELQKKLWPQGTFVDFEHGLATAVKKLRQALDDSAENPRFVETLPRRGYRFIYPVNVGAGLKPAPTVAPVSPPVLWAAMRTSPLQWRIAALAVAVLAATAALVIAFNVAGLRDRVMRAVGAVREPPLQIQSIAVLPLENLSRNPDEDYFADGMTDELITSLGKISALRVISRTSVMQYKGTTKPLPEIARELNVDAVVEGTVQRSGDRVRITANLLHAPTDRHLWAESYERDLRDVLSLQGEVARAIADEVRVKLTPDVQARLARAHPVDPEAYEAYLRGRYFWNKRTEDGYKKAIAYFEQALENDPGYAVAWAGLADCYNLLANYDFLTPKEGFPKAKAAATKALELDETLAEGHASLGYVKDNYEWDWPGAEREIKRAIELAPNRADFHGLHADFLVSMGRLEDAEAAAKRAVELDPFAPREVLLRVYLYARRYDDALREAKRMLEYNPDAGMAQPTVSYSYQLKGMYDEHIAIVEKWPHVLGLSAEDMPAGRKVYESRGWQAFKDWHTEQLEKKRRQGQPVQLFVLAMANAEANHKEEALRWLEKAYEQRNWTMLTLQRWPAWDSLRSDPRFQDLVRRMNFPV